MVGREGVQANPLNPLWIGYSCRLSKESCLDSQLVSSVFGIAGRYFYYQLEDLLNLFPAGNCFQLVAVNFNIILLSIQFQYNLIS